MGEKNKNNKRFLKRVEYWIKGFLFSIGVLSSLAVSDIKAIGTSQEEYDRQIDIDEQTEKIFENNENILTIA